MFPLRELWAQHRKKVFLSLGLVGGCYALYKIYRAQRDMLLAMEVEGQRNREADELIYNQMKDHFEAIQSIADTVTLPQALHQLRLRIDEELDLSDLLAKLQEGKSGQYVLTPNEKMDLWDKVKILSFTRAALSIWSMTMLTLYSRVQVNILGRHLYVNFSEGLGSFQGLVEGGALDSHDQHEFLATADYLSTHFFSTLASNMQKATSIVLKEKRLTDLFTVEQLHETIIQILRIFADLKGSQYWLSYLLPDDSAACSILEASSQSCDNSIESVNRSWFHILMKETRSVISGPDFQDVVDVSLNKVVDRFTEDFRMDLKGGPSAGIPLARIFSKVSKMGPQLFEEPNKTIFVNAIGTLPRVQLFNRLVYSNNLAS